MKDKAQLAFEIGTTEKQLSRIKYCENKSGVMNYIKIAKTLNLDLLEIFKKIKI